MRSETKSEEGESSSQHPAFPKWTSDVRYSGAKKVVPGRIYSMVVHPKTDNLLVKHLSRDVMDRLLQAIRMATWDFGLFLLLVDRTAYQNLRMA